MNDLCTLERMPAPRILIVDDEPSILSLLRLVLESENYEVDTAVSAKEAIQKLTDQIFDLVITDIRMETVTAGFEVVSAVRRGSPELPVALLTAFPVPGSDWKRAGANALFMKGSDSTMSMLQWIQSALAAAKTKSEHLVPQPKERAS